MAQERWSADKLAVAYDDDLLKWQLGKGHPTNPVRAVRAVEALAKLGLPMVVEAIDGVARVPDLLKVHKADYIERVFSGWSREWGHNCRPELGRTAAHMFQGTVQLVNGMLSGRVSVGFSPQGAKHHAQWDTSSGFCVFNDFAWAANELTDRGKRVLYIDLDAHHGDGVEALTLDNPAVMTCSIHDSTIFPAPRSGLGSNPTKHAYNWALPKEADGTLWLNSLRSALSMAQEFHPDVVLIAIGADAHRTDPLSTLKIDYEDYAEAARMIGVFAGERGAPVLMGGAGGYQPLTHTPLVWATFVATLDSVWRSVVSEREAEYEHLLKQMM